jgi:hypothetical protein
MLGPSGIGKSTVLSAALALRNDPPAWLGPDDIASRSETRSGRRLREFRREAFDAPELHDFVSACLDIVHALPSTASHKVGALTMLRQSAVDLRLTEALDVEVPLVHDELLLHRAFSTLPQSANLEQDATTYFTLVPAPQAAVVMLADPDTVLLRIAERGTRPNSYAGLDDRALRGVVDNVVRAGEIAVEVLRARSVEVLELDATASVEQSASTLNSFITEH